MTTPKENKVRAKNDQVDKNKSKNVLITCIHTLQNKSYTLFSLCNIYTGQIADKTVNVNTPVEIGRRQMTSFE